VTINQLIKELDEQKRHYGGNTEVSVCYDGESKYPDWCQITNVFGCKGNEEEMTDSSVTIYIKDEN
jgi:hypothetical protein